MGFRFCVSIIISFALHSVHSQRTCIPDRDDCIYDGSLGYCCSGHCVQNAGEPKGYCKVSTVETTTSQSCISDGGSCKSNEEVGFCCSGNCLQLLGQEFGKCIAKLNTTSTHHNQEECIKDKQTCHRSGSLGNCCSGICFQSNEFKTGFCQTKSNSACLDDGVECHRSGTLGFCCSGWCDQKIEKLVGICGIGNNTGKKMGKGNASDSSPPDFIYGILGLLIVLAAITTCIAIFLYRKRLHKYVLTEEDIKAFLEGELGSQQKDQTNQICNPENIPYDTNSYEIDEKDFKIYADQILGEGAFGLVFKGTVNDEQIAAKTLRRNVEVVYLKALLSELKVMIYLENHVNIIGLVGASTKNLKSGVLYVFYELCPLGSLEKYLRTNRNNYIVSNRNGHMKQNTYENISNNMVEFSDLLTWSYQLANGMDYLVGKRVIHGDLATRNVLLMNKNLIKITDFGLSRRLYEYSNYVKKQQEPLPWRWMAIESLRELKFSSQSDMWSFGVTLWEIYSMGDIPYGGLSWTIDFVSQLLNGLRLQKPIHATDKIYAILIECWNCNENERPSFKDLKEVLREDVNTFTSREYLSST